MFSNKRILVTGGTGSLGKVLIRRLLTGKWGRPAKITVLSRDEAKQHFMRIEYQQKKSPTDEVIYNNFKQILEFVIGDMRDYHTVCAALRKADIVINAAALKQVPSCEYFPFEAVRTNIGAAENIVRALEEHEYPVSVVVGVSTDKACKPVNVMGMTKALQERIFISGNLRSCRTRFVCVRYGNVLASRGSVIPLFHEQILNGGPVTITTPDMTRFLLSLEDAVDTIFTAIKRGKPGETFVPIVPSAKMVDVAKVLIGAKKIDIQITGIRPGEKVNEILVSEEEAARTVESGGYYVIKPILPDIRAKFSTRKALNREYSSGEKTMSKTALLKLLKKHRLLVGDRLVFEGETLR